MGIRDDLKPSDMSVRQATAETNKIAIAIDYRRWAVTWRRNIETGFALGIGLGQPTLADDTKTKTRTLIIANQTTWWLPQVPAKAD